MAQLEDIVRGATVKGILPDGFVTVVDVKWIGSIAVELTYKDSQGRLANELIYRDREAELEILESGKPWSFDGDAEQFRLVSEAFNLPTSSIPFWPSTHLRWNRSPTRSPPCTRLCCRVIHCAFFLPTTPARAKPS